MDKYQILPKNTYNIDEKGFLLRRITKAKRVFPKDLKSLRSFWELTKTDQESGLQL